MAVLLSVIFLSFIGLGLPDTILGSIWPVIQKDMNAPVYSAGIISLIVQAGTVISSLFSSKLVYRYSTQMVTFFSVLLTSIALLIFAFSDNVFFLFFAAVPLGIGAGSVDAALNGYVANNFKSNVMNFLHGFWGVGAFSGPFLMSLLTKSNISWRIGYMIVAGMLLFIALIVFISRKIWTEKNSRSEEKIYISNKEALKIPLVKSALISFSFFSYIELTTGLWISSYFVFVLEVSSYYSALITALFYGSITAGRIILGFFSNRFENYKIIRAGEIVIILGCVLMVAGNIYMSVIGALMIGIGSSPVYPAMLYETPKRFGEQSSLTVMGLQMAVSYTGGAISPFIFGVLASIFSFNLLPYYILFGAVIIFLSSEYLNYNLKKYKAI